MEVSIFPNFSDLLEKHYVEVQLNTDPGKTETEEEANARHRDLQLRLTGSSGRPSYVIVDPDSPDKPVAIFPRADLTGREFGAFLRRHAG